MRWGPSPKVASTIDSAAGDISAADMPCAPRSTTSSAGSGLIPTRNEQTVNATMPTSSIRRRPNRSAARPPNSRNPPNVSTYAVTTQPIAALPKCSCTLMTGSATLVTVTSRMTMNWAIATQANTSHFDR